MDSLQSFRNRIEERIADSSREPHWTPAEANRYMADVGKRREQFEQIAARLDAMVVKPRLTAIASYFSNAKLVKEEPTEHWTCWFGYCERFPASTKLEFAIRHDVRYETIYVSYDVFMTPAFFRFNEHDKLTLPLGEVNESTVANWVEQRLLEFLDAYLRIDRGEEDFDEEAVVDPVCGMRIKRTNAAAQASYRGHPYFFCSAECEKKFSRNPTAYVEIQMM